MTKRTLYAIEAGTIGKPARGAAEYPIRIITEGAGSTGYYSRELIQSAVEIFDGANSFMNHPEPIWRPEARKAETLAGEIVPGSLVAHEVDGLMVLDGKWRSTNDKYASFIAKNLKRLQASIYCPILASEDLDGNTVIDSFIKTAYTSVDIVVAGGRGGRFIQAAESLAALITSEGEPADGTKPQVTSAVESTKEGHMTPEQWAEFTAFATEFRAFVTESAAYRVAVEAAEADETAIAERVSTAAEALFADFEGKVTAINAAENLIPAQKEKLIALARTGADTTEALAAEVKTAEAFRAIAVEGGDAAAGGYVFAAESAKTPVTKVAPTTPKGW